MSSTETELDLLESIHNSKSLVNQRDLARIIGLSLGMTNSILKRLAQKGLLKIKKINNRNIQYVVSPKGIDEIARRSYGYLRRTIKNVVYYKETMEDFMRQVRRRGFRGILLVGESDLEFIVEHVCAKMGQGFRKAEAQSLEEGKEPEGFFLLFSETVVEVEERENSAHLHSILMAAQPQH